mgnify:CR=1 FL=1
MKNRTLASNQVFLMDFVIPGCKPALFLCGTVFNAQIRHNELFLFFWFEPCLLIGEYGSMHSSRKSTFYFSGVGIRLSTAGNPLPGVMVSPTADRSFQSWYKALSLIAPDDRCMLLQSRPFR